MVFGDVSVSKAAFRGSLAIQGHANIADFDIGADKTCDDNTRSLLVGNSLKARSGTINNGYTVVGRGSSIHHSVSMPCTNRIERYSVLRNGDIDFDDLKLNLMKEASKICSTTPTGSTNVENSTLVFNVIKTGFSCYTYFRVTSNDLRLIDTWKYSGTDYYRNNIILVSGTRIDFKEFRMIGFNPRRTLIIFCAVYSSISIIDAKFHASIFSPSATLTTSNAIINGSIIVGGLRGSLATLNIPYATC